MNNSEELMKFAVSADLHDRVYAALYGDEPILDKLVNDDNVTVRVAVASRGIDKYLDKLVYDKHQKVRSVVARIGRTKDLDILINDTNWGVLYEVAEHRRRTDIEKLYVEMVENKITNISLINRITYMHDHIDDV